MPSYRVTAKGRYLACYPDAEVAEKVREYVKINFSNVPGSKIRLAFNEAVERGRIDKPKRNGSTL